LKLTHYPILIFISLLNFNNDIKDFIPQNFYYQLEVKDKVLDVHFELTPSKWCVKKRTITNKDEVVVIII